jgi:hypothetical protein
LGFELVREINKRRLPPNEKAVWKAVADHADDKTGCGAWPSQALLAHETGYSERQVRSILRKLEQRGAIVETRKPGRRTSREYMIIVDVVPLLKTEPRPEEISALGTERMLQALQAGEVKTGNLCNQDRKSLHQDRKSAPVKTGRDFRQTLIEPLKNPGREPSDARARANPGSTDQDIIRGTILWGSIDDDKIDLSEDKARAIKKKRAELHEQQRMLENRTKVANGLSRVIALPGKYSEPGK